MKRAIALQWLAGEVLWPADELRLTKSHRDETTDTDSDKKPAWWGENLVEKGYITKDKPLHVVSRDGGTTEYPSAEAILDDGWVVDPWERAW